MKSLIEYFSSRHMLSNVLFFGMIILGIFMWRTIGKEEMPEFASNWIRVNTIYPGAPAEDVELFVTKPMEEELKGVVGIDEIATTSSVGSSSLRIIIDDDYPDKDEVLQEIKDAVYRVDLPSEVRDLPRIRQFKSSEKAILDIGIYHKNHKNLTTKGREELQKYILAFESQLLSLREISSVERSHYRKPELQILVNPQDNLKYEISLSEVRDQIRNNNIRVPVGSMEDAGESKVTAVYELETVDSLEELVLRSNYGGQGIKLKEIAEIQNGFEKTNSIFKINGHEGVFLNVKKSVSTDILTAQKVVMDFIQKFRKNNSNAPIGLVLMDDESYAVRNRLDIISSNGVMGFVLIILVLLFFLNLKSGFWVAMGIPFCMAFTLTIAHITGYTVNNMTLAGIIIVLGIVVDDAIIIAENITRYKEDGMDMAKAAIIGTHEVVKPIIASITTTCVAFLPLLFFEGFFGKLVRYIPLVIILMLIASLLESIFILPAHVAGKTPVLDRFQRNDEKEHWFRPIERRYQNLLIKIFRVKYFVIGSFLLFLVGSYFVFKSQLKFVMFPREESKEVFIKFKTPVGTVRGETAKIIEPLESLFAQDTKNVVGVRSSIGQSRRGGQVKENEGSILVELFPADERTVPLRVLLEKWESFAKEVPGLESAKFQRGRWGWGSGNALEIMIQENDDAKRDAIAAQLLTSMKEAGDLKDLEIQEPLRKREFLFKLKQDQLIRLNVEPSKVAATLRSFVEGSILYSINKGEEEVDVRLTVPKNSKSDLKELLNLRVENSQGQLIFFRNLVDIEEVTRPVNINRTDYKRTTMVFGNLKSESKRTPLEVADDLEADVFPGILKNFPTAIISFKGEIEDSRESQGEFLNSIVLVIIGIYLILVIMFNSLVKPFLILSIVPFGMSGVVYILLIHGMKVYGFFAVIGALGMIGVVVNDAIVMIDKLSTKSKEGSLEEIAGIAATRLRPVLVTTLTTVVGVLPTAYGWAGFDSMLSEMMLTMGWGLAFGTIITLVLIPCFYTLGVNFSKTHKSS